MAKRPGDVNSATSQWFINLKDNPGLDIAEDGFTVFGRVRNDAGMTVADAIAASPILDGRFALETQWRDVFSDIPVDNLPVENPNGYGCFDLAQLRALVFFIEGQAFLELDSLGRLIFLSEACDGSGAIGLPINISCPSEGRDVVLYDLVQEQGIPPLIRMSCDQIAESEASLDAQRADLAPQVPDQLIIAPAASDVCAAGSPPAPTCGRSGLESASTYLNAFSMKMSPEGSMTVTVQSPSQLG
jgi:hypothetical protein